MGEVIPVKLWDKTEAAKYLGVSPVWILRAARKGLIPSVRVGKRFKFVPAALQRWVEENSSGGDPLPA